MCRRDFVVRDKDIRSESRRYLVIKGNMSIGRFESGEVEIPVFEVGRESVPVEKESSTDLGSSDRDCGCLEVSACGFENSFLTFSNISCKTEGLIKTL